MLHQVSKRWNTHEDGPSGPSTDLQDAAAAARIVAIRRYSELWACSNSHIAGQSRLMHLRRKLAQHLLACAARQSPPHGTCRRNESSPFQFHRTETALLLRPLTIEARGARAAFCLPNAALTGRCSMLAAELRVASLDSSFKITARHRSRTYLWLLRSLTEETRTKWCCAVADIACAAFVWFCRGI